MRPKSIFRRTNIPACSKRTARCGRPKALPSLSSPNATSSAIPWSSASSPPMKNTGAKRALPPLFQAPKERGLGGEGQQNKAAGLHGEIFICIDEVISQAGKFRTSWQKELVRYLIHGVLHLCGYNDRRASARRRMKSEEDRLLRQLA